MSELLLDRAGRRRSPATMPAFHAGHAPGNKGLRYPADLPKIEEIIAVMGNAGDRAHAKRLRGLVVIMWRAGLRIQGSARAGRERSRSAPRLAAGPPRQGRAPPRGRHGRLGLGTTPAVDRRKARTARWSAAVRDQRQHPRRRWSPAAARADLGRTAAAAGVRRRVAPQTKASEIVCMLTPRTNVVSSHRTISGGTAMGHH